MSEKHYLNTKEYIREDMNVDTTMEPGGIIVQIREDFHARASQTLFHPPAILPLRFADVRQHARFNDIGPWEISRTHSLKR